MNSDRGREEPALSSTIFPDTTASDKLSGSGREPKFNSLQALRGVASILVVLFHASGSLEINVLGDFFFGFFRFGSTGVDMFFVLSGFIITYSSRAADQGVSLFIKRRFIRIFPIYWICITGFLLLQLLLPTFYGTPFVLDPINIINTYLLAPGHTMINGVSWTLTHELLFYIMFAFLWFLPKRVALIMSFIVVTGIGFLFIFNAGSQSKWPDVLLSPLNIEFLFGILAARIFRKLSSGYARILYLAGAVVFLISGLIVNMGGELQNFELLRILMFGVPSFMIITGLAAKESNRPVPVPKIMVDIGNASYSLYLIHLPVVAACGKILARTDFSLFVSNILMLFLVVFLTIASIPLYRFIERPLINRLNKLKLGF